MKVIRAIPGRMAVSDMRKLVGELNLTVDRSSIPFQARDLYGDAVLVDSVLAGKVSQHTAFEKGGMYIQTAPSYLAVRHLTIDQASYALDLCASPGGKAIHCYDRFGRAKPVLVNEFSHARRMRLINVMRTYGCQELPMLGIDAGAVCRYVANTIPLILLDVPCSGEAHLVRNPKRLSEWRPRQSKMLAIRQIAMSTGAFHAMAVGGIMLYSTCTISPYENELVIDTLLKKFGSAIELIPWPTDALAAFAIEAHQLQALDQVEDTEIDPRIVKSAWRFWPSAFGEPFFAVMIKKLEPTETKRTPRAVPVAYPRVKGKQTRRPVKAGTSAREYTVPASWPELPGLPYLRVG